MVIRHFTGQLTKVCSFSLEHKLQENKYSILVHDLSKVFLKFGGQKLGFMVWMRAFTGNHEPLLKIRIKLKHFL